MTDAEVTVDQLVAVYLKIRNAKKAATAAHKLQDAKFEESLRRVEMEILQRQQHAGVTGFQIKGVGTTYAREEIRLTIAAEAEFYKFVLEEGDLEFFQRRPSVEHVREWMKNNGGQLPPGLRIFREVRIGVQKPKSSMDSADALTDDES